MSKANSKTPITQTPANTSGKARVDLVKSDFDAVIEQKGYRVYHDKVMRCPCRTNQRTDALSSCRNCGGSGYVYINRFSTRMVLQSINLDTKFKEWSEERIGTVKITAREEEDISFMDRITIRDAESISSEVLYPQNQNDFDGTPRLFARTIYPIVEVDDIFTFEAADKKLVKLTHGVDYTIVEDTNTLVFNNSYHTWKNFTVSIRYKHNPSFYVIDMVRDVMTTTVRGDDGRDTQVQLPVHAVGRRAHYVLDEENIDGTYLLDNSYEVTCLEGVKCPLAPKNVKFNVVDSTTATISWDDVSDVETNYVVERAGPDLIFAEIAILGANTTEYTDTDRVTDQVYFYRVATRATDCQSIWSAPVGLSIAGLSVCPSAIVKNSDESYSVTVASGASLTLPNTLIQSSGSAYSADIPSADPTPFIIPNVSWTDSDGSIQTAEYGSSIIATPCVLPADVVIQFNGTNIDTTPTASTYNLVVQNTAGGNVGTTANPSVVADATIQVNGFNIGSVIAEGAFNQAIQNTVGVAVGTAANPSIVANTTIQINGVTMGSATAESTYNQQVQNSAGTSIGTAANPSVVADARIGANGNFLAQVPATVDSTIDVHDTAGSDVGSQNGITWEIGNTTIRNQANDWNDTELAEGTYTLGLQRVVDSDGSNVDTVDYKPIAGGEVFTCTPQVKELTINAPVDVGDSQSTFTIIADSDGTIDTINNGGLLSLTVKVNTVAQSVPFSLAVGDVVLIEFTTSTISTTITLSGTYT